VHFLNHRDNFPSLILDSLISDHSDDDLWQSLNKHGKLEQM